MFSLKDLTKFERSPDFKDNKKLEISNEILEIIEEKSENSEK